MSQYKAEKSKKEDPPWRALFYHGWDQFFWALRASIIMGTTLNRSPQMP